MSSASQIFFRILRNTKDDYLVQKRTPHVHIPSQVNQVHDSQFNLRHILTLFLQLRYMSFKLSLSLISFNCNLTSNFVFVLCAPLYLVHVILRELIALMIFSGKVPIINLFFKYAAFFAFYYFLQRFVTSFVSPNFSLLSCALL
jgi:hypothetical protein